MAQFEMPENKPKTSVPVDYNSLPEPVVGYDTSGKSVKKSELALWWEGIWKSLSNDILKPTLQKMAYDMFTRGMSMIIFRERGPANGPTNYGGYTPYSGYSGNAGYNPSAYGNPFNAVDAGYSGYGGQSPANSGGESWRCPAFATASDRSKALDSAKQWIFMHKRITLPEFGRFCGQELDWSLNNWGWTNLNAVRERYNVHPKYGIDPRTGEKIALPFELIMPDPVSLV